jgi:hypothetical protein
MIYRTGYIVPVTTKLLYSRCAELLTNTGACQQFFTLVFQMRFRKVFGINSYLSRSGSL